ncbi:MAG: DUF4116 domain-containing protein [Parachlamydiaceae bacterium]|nr:DUF4116 domain-containing protein [Parachlamydiaceae bacterium]
MNVINKSINVTPFTNCDNQHRYLITEKIDLDFNEKIKTFCAALFFSVVNLITLGITKEAYELSSLSWKRLYQNHKVYKAVVDATFITTYKVISGSLSNNKEIAGEISKNKQFNLLLNKQTTTLTPIHPSEKVEQTGSDVILTIPDPLLRLVLSYVPLEEQRNVIESNKKLGTTIKDQDKIESEKLICYINTIIETLDPLSDEVSLLKVLAEDKAIYRTPTFPINRSIIIEDKTYKIQITKNSFVIGRMYEILSKKFETDVKLQNNPEVVLLILKGSTEYYNRTKRIPNIYQGGVVIHSMDYYLRHYPFISPELVKDKDFAISAVKEAENFLKFVPANLQDDEDVVLAAIQHKQNYEECPFQYASDRLRNKKNVVLEAVRVNPRALQFAEAYINDPEVIEEAVKTDPVGFRYASTELRNNKSYVFSLLEKGYNRIFKYLPPALKNDFDFMKQAVSIRGFSLFYASTALKNHKELVLIAIKNCPETIENISSELQEDPEVVAAALDQDPEVLTALSDTQQNIKTNVLKSVSRDGKMLDWVIKKFRDDFDVVLAAVKNNPLALQYASDRLKQHPDIINAFKQGEGLQQ